MVNQSQNGGQMSEELRQRLANQIRLDILLRRVGTTVLRRKFKEIYAKLNEQGKEWTDGVEAGENFCRSRWGNPAYVNANGEQQKMMQGGNIQNWDLLCLQSVITKMLTTARKDLKEESTNIFSRKGPRVDWDPNWSTQMSKIRQLTNIRNSIAHMPSEALSQEDLDEKWAEAVDALKCLGAKSKEIKEIGQMGRSAFPLSIPTQQQMQDQMSNQSSRGHTKVNEEKQADENLEESKVVEEVGGEIQDLHFQSQGNGHDQLEVKNQKDEVTGHLINENVNPKVLHKKNELRAQSLVRRGESAGRSGEWDKALEFYTRALDIPEISDDLQQTIYVNRSWFHLKVLQMTEPVFNFDVPKSGESDTTTNGNRAGESKLLHDQLLEMNHQKIPEHLTEEVKEFHLTSGIRDAESALQLSPTQKCAKAFYRLAQFHQLKGDWNSALKYFDLALGQSDLDDSQLEFDRNVCQLELLNKTEVEEFHWIFGQKNQTTAGLAVHRNPEKWREVMGSGLDDPQKQQQLYAQVVKAHFLAQGLAEEGTQNTKCQEVTQPLFKEVVELYEGAGKRGLPSGIYNLGLLLQEGNGVIQDFSGAVRLFKMAAQFPIHDQTPDWAKEGVFEAQYRLGLCYEFGLGVGKDAKQAIHWYETASLGEFAKASRKLGDIYSQGILGVSKDIDMAIFCWEQAAAQGDTVARTSAVLQFLQLPPVTWDVISYSLYSFSKAITLNTMEGTPTMMAAILDRKRQFQCDFSAVLQDLAQNRVKKEEEENEQEPEEVSWNIPAFIDHTLNTIHLLELAKTPKFQQKLEATPNWRRQFTFTERLVRASSSCHEGLAAVQELNKLYQYSLINANPGQPGVQTSYPPDLRMMRGVDPAILAGEAKLVAVILNSFANSIRLVGAAAFRDQPTQELIQNLVQKTCGNLPIQGVAPTRQEMNNYFNAALIISYTLILKGIKLDQMVEIFDPREGNALAEPFFALSAAAVQGSLGKLELAERDLAGFLKKLKDPQHPHFISKSDLIFAQALCCKSAGLTRGVNSAHRKKVKEAMGLFQKFLSTCPKDEPRRAEAHFQLALCTLYLEKMKVKGQVKGQSPVLNSAAKDILTKVRPHFNQGEEAEQNLPWWEFPPAHKSPIKLILQRSIEELEALVKKVPAQNVTSNSENICFGKLVDPFFKFPTSSLPLKLKGMRRVEVISKFRRFFKAARDLGVGSSSSSALQLAHLLTLPESPFNGTNVFTGSTFVGCYEIVEPVLHCRITQLPADGPEIDKILAFTVVQDDSGALFHLLLTLKPPGGHQKESKVGQIGEFRMGCQVIVQQPFIRLDEDGGTSLIVNDSESQIFPISPPSPPTQEGEKEGGRAMTRAQKCGFCGRVGGKLFPCSKCHVALYCGEDCQAADWKKLKHNWICSFLK